MHYISYQFKKQVKVFILGSISVKIISRRSDEMKQELIVENKEYIEEIIAIITMTFSENPSMYVVGQQTVRKVDVVAVKQKERVHRYGVYLTQAGENIVYLQLNKLADRFKTKYQMDKFDSQKEAKDIMCIYILKEAFRLAKIPFKSNYELQLKEKQRTFSIKMFGFIMFSIFFVAVLVAFIISLF